MNLRMFEQLNEPVPDLIQQIRDCRSLDEINSLREPVIKAKTFESLELWQKTYWKIKNESSND